MLQPATTETREVIGLDGLWSFTIDKNNESEYSLAKKKAKPEKQSIAVPSSYNDLFEADEV